MDMREIRSRNLNFVILDRYSFYQASALNLDRYDLLRYLSSFNDMRELDKRRMSQKKKRFRYLFRAPLFLGKWCGVALIIFMQKRKRKRKNKYIQIQG